MSDECGNTKKKKKKQRKEQQVEIRQRKTRFMKERKFKMVRRGEWEREAKVNRGHEEYQRHSETKCLTP